MKRIYVATYDGHLNSRAWEDYSDAKEFVLGRIGKRKMLTPHKALEFKYEDERGIPHTWLIFEVIVDGVGTVRLSVGEDDFVIREKPDKVEVYHEIDYRNNYDPTAVIIGDEVECDHRYTTYDDIEEQSQCPTCGAVCDWHMEQEEFDGHMIDVPVAHEWYETDDKNCAIAKYWELKNAR